MKRLGVWIAAVVWVGCSAPESMSEPKPDSGSEPGDVDASAADAAEPGAAVRVMTFNLRNPLLGGDAEQRTQMVIDAVTALSPDFVALQEIVEQPTMDNRAEVIAAATGYEWAWAVSTDATLYTEGTGLLSRWPLTWTEHVELPHMDLGINTRVTVGATADTPSGPKQFFAGHWTISDDPQVKADQARASLEFVRQHAQAGAVLAGDFNATPDSLAMQLLRGDASHGGVTGDLSDAWQAARPGDPGFTFPSDDPDQRIDYIYVVPASDGSRASVADCVHVLADPDGGLYASDHIGVLCDLTSVSASE